MSYFQAYRKVLKVEGILLAVFLLIGFIGSKLDEHKGVDPA